MSVTYGTMIIDKKLHEVIVLTYVCKQWHFFLPTVFLKYFVTNAVFVFSTIRQVNEGSKLRNTLQDYIKNTRIVTGLKNTLFYILPKPTKLIR